MEDDALIERIRLLLTVDELAALVDALERISAFRNGFGQVMIEMEKKRIKQIAVTSTMKPGVK